MQSKIVYYKFNEKIKKTKCTNLIVGTCLMWVILQFTTKSVGMAIYVNYLHSYKNAFNTEVAGPVLYINCISVPNCITLEQLPCNKIAFD